MSGSADLGTAPTTAPAEVPASRLLLTLAFGGAFAGLLIATVYERTLPAIEKYADSRIEGAVNEVLGGPARFETLYLSGETLSKTPPSGVPLRKVTKAYVGFNDQNARVGVAVEASAPGFADEVKLMVGFDPATGALTGFSVLAQKETPGLGDKIELAKSKWIRDFEGKSLESPPAEKWAVKKDGGVFDQFAGATITPRAVVKAVKEGMSFYAAHRDEILEGK